MRVRIPLNPPIIHNVIMKELFYIFLFLMVVFAVPYHIRSESVTEASAAPQESPVVPMEKVSVPDNPTIVLITIDGVRWQDMFTGPHLYPLVYKGKTVPARELVPNLYHYFVDNGMVAGRDSEFLATGPMHISLPGYLEIMRGHPSFDCQTNDCEPKIEPTIADLFETSAVFSSWEVIDKAVGANHNKFVVNCGRDHRSDGWKQLGLPDNQKFQEYWEPHYRPDFLTQEAVLKYLENNHPQFLWVSLGDTDEWAHAGNYDKYIESLVEADKFVGQMVAHFPGKNTTFIVTADHGRGLDWRNHGRDVESSRDWLMMYGANIPPKGFVKYTRIRRLSDILPTVKHLLGKPSDDSLLMGL